VLGLRPDPPPFAPLEGGFAGAPPRPASDGGGFAGAPPRPAPDGGGFAGAPPLRDRAGARWGAWLRVRCRRRGAVRRRCWRSRRFATDGSFSVGRFAAPGGAPRAGARAGWRSTGRPVRGGSLGSDRRSVGQAAIRATTATAIAAFATFAQRMRVRRG